LKKIADPAVNKAEYLADSTSVVLYAGRLLLTGGMIAPTSEVGQSVFTLTKSGSNDYYNGFLTLFAQELFKKEANKKRFRYFALFPETPQIGKTVNRLIFQEQNIKLRVYYTRPAQPTP